MNLISTAGSSFSIVCNTTYNQPVVWIRTINETGAFYVKIDNRTFTTNNGKILNFTNVILPDEDYYGCGYVNTNNSFQVLQSFFLYVKGMNLNLNIQKF
jgi:hypothetical protein